MSPHLTEVLAVLNSLICDRANLLEADMPLGDAKCVLEPLDLAIDLLTANGPTEAAVGAIREALQTALSFERVRQAKVPQPQQVRTLSDALYRVSLAHRWDRH